MRARRPELVNVAKERAATASFYSDESEAAEWRADLARAEEEIRRREI